MNRAERRRQGIKGKEPTLMLTRSQMQKMQDDAAADILSVLFTLPCIILMQEQVDPEYINEFVDKLGELYTDYVNNTLDMKTLRNDLWDYAGVKFERE